jgi:preprotein translocase subunit SecG
MTLTILNVVYVCVAIAMVVLILMQRGAGAQAGSGFGAGASATVFGARGAGNFLSKSTKWLAIAFFALSLGIGMFVTHRVASTAPAGDLGVMGAMEAPASDVPAPSSPAAVSDVPAVPTPADAAVPAGDGEAPATLESPPEAAQKDGSG